MLGWHDTTHSHGCKHNSTRKNHKNNINTQTNKQTNKTTRQRVKRTATYKHTNMHWVLLLFLQEENKYIQHTTTPQGPTVPTVCCSFSTQHITTHTAHNVTRITIITLQVTVLRLPAGAVTTLQDHYTLKRYRVCCLTVTTNYTTLHNTQILRAIKSSTL